MMSISPSSPLAPVEGYRLWARKYDDEANPMLSLENRILRTLLPRLAGLDIADLGCGTGRWLNILQHEGLRSMTGVDASEEMLAKAKEKLGTAIKLVCADYKDAPLARASYDVVFSNFVLSYIEDAAGFFQRVRTVLRPGGLLVLSDVHPDTIQALNWRRGVSIDGEFKEIRTHNRSMASILALGRKAGLEIEVHVQPSFGVAERGIFERRGKVDELLIIGNRPAIYLLFLRAPGGEEHCTGKRSAECSVNRLTGARFALGSVESGDGVIQIQDSCIAAMGQDTLWVADTTMEPEVGDLDLSGYLVLPGLINAHDHLEFALFPRLGRGGYKNFLEWAKDIHEVHSEEIDRQRRVPKTTRLWWGGIRNLLSGVTTVCHHNPYEETVFSTGFPVRVLADFAWAHSLALDSEAARKKQGAPSGRPFFIHLAEGIDDVSAEEIFSLNRAGALNEDTVVIHGLGMRGNGRALLQASGARLIWCPSSNLFLFGESLGPDDIRQIRKVALGSDSSLTADGDLLDEVRCAHEICHTPTLQLYGLVTHRAARVLGLRNGEGTLRVGGTADLIAVKDTGAAAAEVLPLLSYRDVELVLLGGHVKLASNEMRRRLPPAVCQGLQPLWIEGITRWIRAPLDELFEETTRHLGGEIFLGGREVRFGN